MKIIEWHKNLIKWWQEKTSMSDYALHWLSFIEGVLITVLIIWLICLLSN